MQAISAGDLYFLQSPFTSGIANDAEEQSKQEKRLSYLLGTVSSRPAIVIRPPAWWDRFNTVTVIPAITKGKPAIVLRLNDKYGFETDAEYPFVPHNPHTIPVARLGRYIGRLDDDELAEILYAFEWIHDPIMQRDKTIDVPKIYRDVFAKAHPPKSWSKNQDARSAIKIGFGDDMRLQSPTHPEVNGLEFGTALGKFVDPKINSDKGFVPVESALPDVLEPDDITKEETDMSKENGARVPVEKGFPKSIFSTDDLWKVASRFTIDESYYDGSILRRDPIVLTEAEQDKIFKGVGKMSKSILLDSYIKMTPFDAFLLGPRLPLPVVAELLDITRDEAHSMKLLCNTMRSMTEEDYQVRIAAQSTPKQEDPTDERAEVINSGVESKFDMAAASEKLAKLRPYLDAKNVMKIPAKLQDDFVSMPQFMIQRAWKGPQFKTFYKKAIAHYINKK